MFPDIGVDDLAALIDAAPPNASTQLLVDLAIQRQSQLQPPTPTPPPSSSSSSPAFEMTSLLPAHSDSATFPVPSAPLISSQHATLLSAVATVHGGLLSSASPPTVLQSHLHSLLRVISNPIQHPSVQKYRVLPLNNPKFNEKVLSLQGAKAVLLAIGFVSITGEAGESLLILGDAKFDLVLLQEAQRLIEGELSFVSSLIPPPQPHAQERRVLESVVDHPIYQSKRAWRDESRSGPMVRTDPILVPTPRLSREQLAAVAEHRIKPSTTLPPSLPAGAASTEVRRGRQMRLEDVRRRRREMEDMRKEKKEKWQNTTQGRRRVITVDDLDRMRLEEVEQRARLGLGMSDEELIEIGKEATRLTNEFRKEQGVYGEVLWHAELAEIGWKHSKNMGEGVVPVGHEGFSDRTTESRMSGLGENVFMTSQAAAVHVAKMAVDGWIDSPGHRANMLRPEWVYSGIGIYRKGNAYWFTQLFGRP